MHFIMPFWKFGRPDMTFAVDWALKTNDLSIYREIPAAFPG